MNKSKLFILIILGLFARLSLKAQEDDKMPRFFITQNKSGKYGLEVWDKVIKNYKIFIKTEYDKIIKSKDLYVLNKYGSYDRFLNFVLEKNGQSTLFQSGTHLWGNDFSYQFLFDKEQFEKIVVYDGFAVIKKNNQYGVIQLSNKEWLLNPVYDTIITKELNDYPSYVFKPHQHIQNYVLLVQKNNKTGIYVPEKQQWLYEIGKNSFQLSFDIHTPYLYSYNGNKQGLLYLQINATPSEVNGQLVYKLTGVKELLPPLYENTIVFKNNIESKVIRADSLKKIGLWLLSEEEGSVFQLSSCELDSIQMRNHTHKGMFEVYKNGLTGLIHDDGWIHKPMNVFFYNTAAIANKKVSVIQERTGKIVLVCAEKDSYQEVSVKDTNTYSSFEIHNNYILARGNTNALFKISYQLRADTSILLQSLVPLATNVKNLRKAYYNENIIFFESLGNIQWLLTQTNGSDTIIKPAIKNISLDPYYIFENGKQKNYFLISKEGKHGVIDQYGKLIIPIENKSFYTNDNRGVFFVGPDLKSRRELNLKYLEAKSMNEPTSETPYVSLRTAKNVIQIDFDSIFIGRQRKAYRFNNNWYFNINGALVMDNDRMYNGTILHRQLINSSECVFFEKPTGVGLQYNGITILPPYFKALKIFENYSYMVRLYLFSGDSVKIELEALDKTKPNILLGIGNTSSMCYVCRGTGLSNNYETYEVTISEGSKSVQSEKKYEYYTEYEKVYDQVKRRYETVPRTRVKEYYDITVKDKSPNTQTRTRKAKCNRCSGTGRLSGRLICELKGDQFVLDTY